jgi:hypothetical protein
MQGRPCLVAATGVTPVFRIDLTERGARLVANEVLTPEDFASIARELGQTPVRARKIGYVAARRAEKPEVVETRWNGKETTNTAQPGDYIVTNLSPEREPLRDGEGRLNVYVILADKFPDLYEPTPEMLEHGTVYRAKGVVSALPLPGGLSLVAPWGERQAAASGYLLLGGKDVYAINAEAFAATYEEVAI